MTSIIKGNKLFSGFILICILLMLQTGIYILTKKDNWKYLKIITQRGMGEYFIGPKVAVIHKDIAHKNTINNFRVLYWTSSFRGKNWFGIGKDLFSKCSYKNCVATNDKALYNFSHAVLMQMSFVSVGYSKLPSYKFSNQKWIFHVMEAPANEESYSKYNGLFNATWTYSRKSDMWSGYFGNLVLRKQVDNKLTEKDYAANKTKLIAWFVSNCGSVPSSRMQYVRNLNTHIPVDVYGECGKHKCKRSKSQQCDQMLEKDYKFYLSLENSLCHDYVTEKLSRALKLNIVPIVLGAANYSEFLPQNSYLDIKDFKSPKELADYLMVLNKNDTLYNSYLKWKGSYEFEKQPVPAQCQLCEYLNKTRNQTKVYDNMEKTWSKSVLCYSPETFYPNVDKSSWEYNMLTKHSMLH